MHIPDGFLNAPTLGAGLIISGVTLSRTLGEVNRNIETAHISLMGLMAGMVFMLQLLSIPVIGGTSTHLTGALLISLLLGPKKGFIVMSSALFALALLFQHGGLLSLGVNIFNIAILGCFVGYGVLKLLPAHRVSIIVAALIINLLAALFCAAELAGSGMLDLSVSLPIMLLVYGVTGLAEGVMTVLVMDFIRRVKPEILVNSP